MDQSSYAWLRRELRQHMDILLTGLDDLVRRTEGLSPAIHNTLQSGVADLKARLQAFDDLLASCLTEGNANTEAQDALARLIEQVHAQQQEVEDEIQRIRDAPTEDWESRLVMLEVVWSQLDKTARTAMQELAPKPRPDET